MAFQHLELMLELAGRSSMPATEPSQKQPPGWAVMHDVLSNGPVMQVHACVHVCVCACVCVCVNAGGSK